LPNREEQLEELLAQFIKPMRGIPFEIVIRSICGKRVQKIDPTDEAHMSVVDQISQMVIIAGENAGKVRIVRPRPNEVGNDMEAYVLAAAAQLGIEAASPKTAAGAGKATGYPDIRITTSIGTVYLEVKTYARENHETTQRSFYLSPAEDPKVSDDGYHLLVGYEMVDLGVNGTRDSRNRDLRAYSPTAVTLVDLFGLNGDMKFEYNSDNRRLYSRERLLFSQALGM
jgi:hypothetical protein